jgi:hypothetical protein
MIIDDGQVFITIACNMDADMLAASFPLLSVSKVETIEWLFDTLFHVEQIPSWFLVEEYLDWINKVKI